MDYLRAGVSVLLFSAMAAATVVMLLLSQPDYQKHTDLYGEDSIAGFSLR
jgi:hypothetical protein